MAAAKPAGTAGEAANTSPITHGLHLLSENARECRHTTQYMWHIGNRVQAVRVRALGSRNTLEILNRHTFRKSGVCLRAAEAGWDDEPGGQASQPRLRNATL